MGLNTIIVPTWEELIKNEKAKTEQLKKDIAAQPFRNRDKNYQFLIQIGYKPEQLTLKTPKQLQELVAIESRNYNDTAQLKSDTKTKEQHQQNQKQAAQRLETSKQLKDTEQASTMFSHVPIFRTLNSSSREHLNRSLGNKEAANQAAIETAINLIGDAFDLGFGLKSPTSLATSYLGDWVGGAIGSQYGNENLGRFVGSIAGGFTPDATNWLYRRVAPKTFQLAREMNNSILTPTETLPLNIGWGPKQTIAVTHKSNSAKPLTLFNPKRYDVVNEGANPLGVWFQGNLGVPRTIETAATAQKAAKAEKARNLFVTRPYTHSSNLTLEKPIITVGEVPDRSALSYQAEQMGADGLIYNHVYDNGYDNNQVVLSFKQPNKYKVQYPPYQIKQLPGYQIKSLFIGSPLEKQLSKNGTLSIKQLQAYINRNDVSDIDKEMLNRVLQNHANDTHIDYNTLRQEVQEMIPKYNRIPQIAYQDYGIRRLGYKTAIDPNIPDDNFILQFTPHTFTFESPGIKGNTRHYPGQPIGHSRTYTTSDEPDILYVMESQSDWAQSGGVSNSVSKKRVEQALNFVKNDLESGNYGFYTKQELEQKIANLTKQLESYNLNSIQSRMINTYLSRQLQENLQYAAQHRQTKMRYPTPETAAKIEGYQKIKNNNTGVEFEIYNIEQEIQKLNQQQSQLLMEELNKIGFEVPSDKAIEIANNKVINNSIQQRINQLANQIQELKQSKYQYSPEHQTILKKYTDFPKQFQKLFGKNTQVRTVTDSKGNTWYEVDVPENYLNGTAEMLFKKGGKVIQRFRNRNKRLNTN